MNKITLRMAREAKGYTVEEIAKHCDVSVERMKNLEDNPKCLKASILFKLRCLYNIPVDYCRL